MSRLSLTGPWPALLAAFVASAVLLVASFYVLVSAVWVDSIDDREAIFSLLDRLSLIGFLLFFLAPVVYRTPSQRMHLLVGLVALGAYLAFTALVQELNLDSLVW